MTIELTLSIASLIAAAGAFVTAIKTLTEMRIKLAEHEKVMYSENGEVRLVSFTAHERLSMECRKGLVVEGNHLRELVARLEADGIRREEKFEAMMKRVENQLTILSECVTKLSVGVKC